MNCSVFIKVLALVLAIFSTANAENLEYVWSDLWEGISDVHASGHYAYCAYNNGMQVFDMSDPTDPKPAGRIYFPGKGNGIWVEGNYAYLADDSCGLQIIDISNPRGPVSVGSYDSPAPAMDVIVSGNYAFLADGYDDGLRVVDISDPAHPAACGHYSIPGVTKHIDLWNDYVCVVRETPGGSNLFIINVSDPSNPDYMSLFNLGTSNPQLCVYDHYVLCSAGDTGLKIVDIEDPAHPHLSGRLSSNSYIYGIAAVENYAYYLGGYEDYRGLVIVDISDPANPEFLRCYNADGNALHIDGQNLYVGAQYIGLTLLNISDPANPALRGRYTHYWFNTDVLISGHYAYAISGWAGGMQIFDFADPQNVRHIGEYLPYDGVNYGFISGDYAYVINDSSGFHVVDISNPQNPIRMGSNNRVGGNAIFVDGDYAYVPVASRLNIINIADPMHPVIANTYQLPQDIYCRNWAIAISNGYAYVATSDSGLQILNVENPPHPTYVTKFRVMQYSSVSDVIVSGDYAYIANQYNGVIIIDIQDPAHPRRVASCHTSLSYTAGVAVDSNFVYSCDERTGVQVFDISNRGRPVLTAVYDTPGWADKAAISNGYSFIADNNSIMMLRLIPTGISDDDVTLPGEFYLSQNYPNPFNAGTTIQYDLPFASNVNLAIYDILGRQVEVLQSGFQQAGSHSLIWNAGGNPSGIYFYRITTDRFDNVKSCILLK